MSRREVERATVLERVRLESIGLGPAASLLGLSYRQTKRIYARYKVLGGGGLVHASVGRPSNRAHPHAEREMEMSLIRQHYGGEKGKGGPGEPEEKLGAPADHGTGCHPDRKRPAIRPFELSLDRKAAAVDRNDAHAADLERVKETLNAVRSHAGDEHSQDQNQHDSVSHAFLTFVRVSFIRSPPGCFRIECEIVSIRVEKCKPAR